MHAQSPPQKVRFLLLSNTVSVFGVNLLPDSFSLVDLLVYATLQLQGYGK